MGATHPSLPTQCPVAKQLPTSPVAVLSTSTAISSTQLSTASISRWDELSGDVSWKITFPVRDSKEKVLQQLVEDCQPATFGFEGKDVLNEKIRKAGKLEAS